MILFTLYPACRRTPSSSCVSVLLCYMYSVRRVPATAAPRGFSGEVESRFVGRAALSRGKAATASELGEEGERASERAAFPSFLPLLCFALPSPSVSYRSLRPRRTRSRRRRRRCPCSSSSPRWPLTSRRSTPSARATTTAVFTTSAIPRSRPGPASRTMSSPTLQAAPG